MTNDNTAATRWQGYGIGTTEAEAKALFARRYGVRVKDVKVKVTGGAVLAGPIPEQSKP